MTTDFQHEHQQDDELTQLLHFLKTHGKIIIFTVCAVVAITLAMTTYQSNIKKTNFRASSLFATAANPQDFQSIIDQYPSAEIIPVVLLGLAKSYYNSMNFAMALRKYEEFKETYPDHDLSNGAEIGRIHCLEAMGRKQEALLAFTTFIQQNPKHYMIAQVKLGAARCTEQVGDLKAAKALYEDFMEEYNNSDWASLADQRLKAIEHKLKTGKTGTENTSTLGQGTLLPPIDMKLAEP